ncbi:BICD family-like cargo adapter 2 isoform X1 [Fukomys damarensis]|uniref:BICD family-like cargo adapter 2 isoform X1 n=1 Tax=Fukomys damarensis TaxID=885580 RepID=UPI00053F464B|nr:BICD family-like cargo adapter 2 isoform X1 [Fukomys damarensis]
MGRGLNSTRLRRQKRRLRPRVQEPRQQPEVSGYQGGLTLAVLGSAFCSPWNLLSTASDTWVSAALCPSFLLSCLCPTPAPSRALFGSVSLPALWVSSSLMSPYLRPSAWSPQRLKQENHELRRGLAARGAEWESRAVELEGDLAALRAQLGEQRSEQQDSGRERARALGELSEQNLRLSQELAQASQTEHELQRELDALRAQCQAQALAGVELRTQLESLHGENQMLQSRRHDLEAQIRGLREEVDKGQGRLQTTHEELMLLRRERREDSLELERARFEAGEALNALRRLQRRVSELEEESHLQDTNVSSASLQSELAHSLDSDRDQEQDANAGEDTQITSSPETQEASVLQSAPQVDSLEPPKKRAPLSPAEILEEKEAEAARLQDEIALQQAELQTLREELQRQKELRAQDNPEEALRSALSDRDEAVNKALELSLELNRVSLERDSLSRELLRTIRQKVALTQELEAWQDDMQVVIGQQLRSQRQKELNAAASGPRRTSILFTGSFLSNFFRRT